MRRHRPAADARRGGRAYSWRWTTELPRGPRRTGRSGASGSRSCPTSAWSRSSGSGRPHRTIRAAVRRLVGSRHRSAAPRAADAAARLARSRRRGRRHHEPLVRRDPVVQVAAVALASEAVGQYGRGRSLTAVLVLGVAAAMSLAFLVAGATRSCRSFSRSSSSSRRGSSATRSGCSGTRRRPGPWRPSARRVSGRSASGRLSPGTPGDRPRASRHRRPQRQRDAHPGRGGAPGHAYRAGAGRGVAPRRRGDRAGGDARAAGPPRGPR